MKPWERSTRWFGNEICWTMLDYAIYVIQVVSHDNNIPHKPALEAPLIPLSKYNTSTYQCLTQSSAHKSFCQKTLPDGVRERLTMRRRPPKRFRMSSSLLPATDKLNHLHKRFLISPLTFQFTYIDRDLTLWRPRLARWWCTIYDGCRVIESCHRIGGAGLPVSRPQFHSHMFPHPASCNHVAKCSHVAKCNHVAKWFHQSSWSSISRDFTGEVFSHKFSAKLNANGGHST